MLRKITYMIFSVLTHVITLASFLAFLLFLAGAIPGDWLSKPADSAGEAALTNIGIVLLWSLQHTGMASATFRKWTARFVPAALERSVYCAATSAALLLIVCGWAPIPDTIFSAQDQFLQILIHASFWIVWGLFLVSVASDSYLEFFGLKQAYFYMTGRVFRMSSFKTDGLHQFVRHPSLALIIPGLWITPFMTSGRFMLASLMTLYTVLGALSVDRKYVRYYGEAYVRRQQDVPLLVPRLFSRRGRPLGQA